MAIRPPTIFGAFGDLFAIKAVTPAAEAATRKIACKS
jgi:hypothetical protein